MCTKFDDVMSERGISSGSIRPCGEFIQSMYGMYASMREVARILIPDKDAEYFKEGGQIYRALQVVAMKVCNPERIDNAADEGLKLNGVDYHGEEHQNNAFLPWNGIQVNFLARNFDKMSDEELAKALGRSVGAVKAKMRQLKLKRNND